MSTAITCPPGPELLAKDNSTRSLVICCDLKFSTQVRAWSISSVDVKLLSFGGKLDLLKARAKHPEGRGGNDEKTGRSNRN